MTIRTIDNAQAWLGPEMARRQDWQHELTDADLAELRRALDVARASGRELQHLGAGQFPLDRLATKLAALRGEALHGRGFFLLRGLPVESYSPWEAAAAFWGMGLYLGEAVSQNGKGHVLGHVANLGLDWSQSAAMGDDWPDLPMMRHAALACAPANAHAEVLARAHFVTPRSGGHGAVRDLCDVLLWGGDHYQALLASYTQ
jgi:hypothetical protein